MKLTGKYLEKDGSGKIILIAEEGEDLWHVYNLLAKGDLLKATTVRRVVSEGTTGSTEKTSHKINLTIAVESLFFDVQAATLRVNGRNVLENKYVKMGGFHTLDLELHRSFTITKDCWDVIHLDRIADCCDVAKRAEIAAVVMHEGLAQICLVTDSMTVVKLRIETNVPKKRRGTTTDHDKGLLRFFDQLYQGICAHINFNVIKVLIIASPGFYKDAAHKYIVDQALKNQYKPLLDNRSKILLVHSSSGHLHALSQILLDPFVQSQLSETKYAKENAALLDFYKMLSVDDSRAFYGFEYVTRANDMGAIQTLLITDELFRSSDIIERKKYIALVENVKALGGTVMVFSSLHTSGQQLCQLTGVAAILQFGLAELENQVALEQEKKERGKLFRPQDEDAIEDLDAEM